MLNSLPALMQGLGAGRNRHAVIHPQFKAHGVEKIGRAAGDILQPERMPQARQNIADKPAVVGQQQGMQLACQRQRRKQWLRRLLKLPQNQPRKRQPNLRLKNQLPLSQPLKLLQTSQLSRKKRKLNRLLLQQPSLTLRQ